MTTTTSSNLGTVILAMMMLTGIVSYFAYQIYIFMKDFRFYRRVKWDLSKDSGNRMLWLETLKGSIFFGKYPVGYLRLIGGYQHFVFVLMVLTVGPFFGVLSSSSGVSEIDKQFIALAWLTFGLVYFLLNWIVDAWLHNRPGWPQTAPGMVETYIGKRVSPKLYMTAKHVFFVLLVLFLAYTVLATPDIWQLNQH